MGITLNKWLFNSKFIVFEIRDSGVTIKHYLKGNRLGILSDVESYKKLSKKYEYLGKNKLVVWM